MWHTWATTAWLCVCVFTCYRPADAVQMCDVGVGGVDLEEEVFDLTVAVVTEF